MALVKLAARQFWKRRVSIPILGVQDLSEAEVTQLRQVIDSEYVVEGDLRREVAIEHNIKRLTEIGCYRGLRHRRHLPVHGQRTKTNARCTERPQEDGGRTWSS